MKIEISKLVEKGQNVVLPDLDRRIIELEDEIATSDWFTDADEHYRVLSDAYNDRDRETVQEAAYELYQLERRDARVSRFNDLREHRKKISKFLDALALATGDSVNYNPNGAWGTESYSIREIINYKVQSD